MIREFILKQEEWGREKEIIYFSFNDKINKIELLKHFAIGSEQVDLIKTKISIEEINE
jgi:hypothetical protein